MLSPVPPLMLNIMLQLTFHECTKHVEIVMWIAQK